MIVSYQIEALGAGSGVPEAHASSHAAAGGDPVTLTQGQITGLIDDLALKATTTALAAHTGSSANPHNVTKAQVGLGNCDNTSDANKPVSTATQTALDAKASTASLTAHTGDTNNPHNVTKAQVGLGNCDNTSDANKPVSTATQTALDAKASTASLTAHTGDTGNPHNVTKAQVGLGNCDNTNDANKPVSTATQTALDAKADALLQINAQTSNYTLVLGDAGKMIVIDSSSANVLTIPPESGAAFAVGTQIAIAQFGSGSTDVSPDTGVTLVSRGSATTLSGQYATAALLKTGADQWLLSGSLV